MNYDLIRQSKVDGQEVTIKWTIVGEHKDGTKNVKELIGLDYSGLTYSAAGVDGYNYQTIVTQVIRT